MTVAFSRARRGLIVVGDRETLGKQAIWKVILDEFVTCGAIVNSGNIFVFLVHKKLRHPPQPNLKVLN